ncbi:uncharacterized protein LOC142570655 [Dermacentor variabilis]|uniref:uncharacterized protein LOC142570655 n=1 Tax=Dermacentor variabilis TaxID=34621 RepID=UPI003F5B0732
MVGYCTVPQCRTYATEPDVSLHTYPRDKRLREAWITKLRTGKQPSATARVCSKHFREEDFCYGVGAAMFGWKRRWLLRGAIPSRNLPVRPLDRPLRPQRPQNRLQIQDRPLAETFHKDDPATLAVDPQASTSSPPIHTDEEQDSSETCSQAIPSEVLTVTTDIGVQVNTLDAVRSQPLSIAAIQDEKALIVLTGLTFFQLFYNLCDLYTDCRLLSHAKGFCISNEDAVLLTFMKLQHNLTFSVLGVLFGVHRTTAADIFKASVTVLAAILREAVYWPTKEAVDNMTVYFKDYTTVRAVLDCTEIPLQRPKDMESQLLTYSWYKGTYTAKILVCETPGGHISYVSNAYGGRASDSFITKECRVLEKFLPSIDSVMVDKGFLIDKLCHEHHIKMVRPPFLKTKKQLSKDDAERNQSIAAARVHVERAIQRMKAFKILGGNVGIELFPFIDDIVHIIAGIVNLSKPIFSDDKFLN